MKKTLIALAAIAATGFGAVALADEALTGPVLLTDSQMGNVVAGQMWAWGRNYGANFDQIEELYGTNQVDDNYVGDPTHGASRPGECRSNYGCLKGVQHNAEFY